LQGQRALAFATYALAVLLLGAALHYLVERPFLRLRERGKARASPLAPGGETATRLATATTD
jgi:peptidoglycan/LPS O-acetylase OafA/YrhL